MTENTKIEWAHHTHNPWIGCTRISPACDHCYAAEWDKRYEGGEHWGAGAPRRRTSLQTRNAPYRWARKAADTGERPRVFCCSLADVFDNEVPQEWRDDLWQTIRDTPELDWLLLTKRIGNVERMLPDDWGNGWSHVWLGITVVTQDEADRDIPKLLETPAAVRFLSCEPLLSAVDLYRFMVGDGHDMPHFRDGPLHWIIAGGESGPQARPSHPNWFRSLRDQCQVANVPFFFKQWGEWVDEFHPAADTGKHGTSDEFVDIIFDDEGRADDYRGVYMCHVGKKRAGRQLDGRTWDEVLT